MENLRRNARPGDCAIIGRSSMLGTIARPYAVPTQCSRAHTMVRGTRDTTLATLPADRLKGMQPSRSQGVAALALSLIVLALSCALVLAVPPFLAELRVATAVAPLGAALLVVRAAWFSSDSRHRRCGFAGRP